MASSNDELERLINLLRDEGEERRKLGFNRRPKEGKSRGRNTSTCP